MQDAEALLLVDHDQTEVLENDVAGNEPMRADDDIDAAFAQKLQDFALLGVRAETAEHFDADRVIEHALPEGFEMLLREDGGRREDGDLFAFHDRFEGGANRHLRFAETDVAADQAIHRTRLLHVALGGGDGRELVRRFAVGERMFELALPFRVGAEGVAELRFALGLHGQHLAGVVEDRGDRVLLRPRPFGIRERAERRRFFPDADIARDEIRLLERDVEFRFIREFEREDFLHAAALRRERASVAENVRRRARGERRDRLR